MATSEDHLAQLERRLAALRDTEIGSAEELVRAEQVRFAERFGGGLPQFRTALRLRFFGPGVDEHDLPSEVAGSVIKRIGDAVRAAGTKLQNATPKALSLFLSPSIAPGSTILELYGPPRVDDRIRGVTPALGGDILDTPVDAALGRLFDAIERAASPGVEIAGELGKPLFGLAKDLLDGDVDVDIQWQRPRGSTRRLSIDRTAARNLRTLLDRETVDSVRRDGIGELVSLSTDGRIGIRLTGMKKSTALSVGVFDVEALRPLWARQIAAAWLEETKSHPQRDTQSITNTLIEIRLADHQEPPAQGQLPNLS